MMQKGYSMLNEDQQMAVRSEGHTMVVAIPGSGKTEVSARYAENILSHDPNAGIAMLTFTDAAANNLKRRLKGNLQRDQLSRAFPSTFHSMAVRMWRTANDYKAIVMGGHWESYVERAVRDSGSAMDYEVAKAFIDKIGQHLEVPESEYSSIQLKMFSSYTKLLNKENKVDLNQISREVIIGMRNGSILPLTQTMGLTHICADEFQDSDDLQYDFLVEHAKHGATIMVVGDDDQSIFGFRNANGVKNFTKLQESIGAKAYSLKVCYRCPQSVLNVANNLIQYNQDRIPKQLISNLEDKGKVELNRYTDEQSQCEEVVCDIISDPCGWAILARTNKELDLIELEMAKHKLPIQRIGGKSFLDANLVVSYIKLVWMLTHSNSRYISDAMGFTHCKESDINQVKEMVSQGIPFRALTTHIIELSLGTPAFLDIIRLYEEDKIPKTESKIENAFFQRKLLGGIRFARSMKFAEPMATMADILTRTAYECGCLDQAVDIFHERITKVNSKKDIKIDDSMIVLSTLHGAKGLEFSKVVILSCQNDRIPQKDKDGLGEKHIEEERRLFYVGITRAESYLRLCYFKNKTRFLAEAAPDELEKVNEGYDKQPTDEKIPKITDSNLAKLVGSSG